jgi:hypothetical protein
MTLCFVPVEPDMHTAATRRKAASSPVIADEGQCFVYSHSPQAADAAAVMDAAIHRLTADKRRGDVVKVLREFRDSPRGE